MKRAIIISFICLAIPFSRPGLVIASEFGEVTKVIDGDTIVVDNGEKIRYIGIDTPELNHGKKGKRPECYAREAALKNHELVYGKTVRLESDTTDRDKYGRLLRYIYVGETRINDYLVKSGHAKAYIFPDDKKYAKEILSAEREAKENKAGLWSRCGNEKSEKESEDYWKNLSGRIIKLRSLIAEMFNPRRIKCSTGDCL